MTLIVIVLKRQNIVNAHEYGLLTTLMYMLEYFFDCDCIKYFLPPFDASGNVCKTIHVKSMYFFIATVSNTTKLYDLEYNGGKKRKCHFCERSKDGFSIQIWRNVEVTN
jgi:hypothetical protein